jgi:hypothetical protein
MPEVVVNAVEPSVQSNPTPTEADLELALGGGTPKAPVPPTEATPAPAAGNPASPAPVVEQPGQASDTKTDTKIEAPAEAVVDPLAELGLEAEQQETVETVQKRYEESSREARRLVADQQARDKVLAEMGLEVVNTRKGYQLRATEKFKAEIKDEDIPNVLIHLTEEERKLVDPETAKKIQKLTLAETLAKRPPVHAEQEPKMISEIEIHQVFSRLADAKLGDKPLLPGFSEPDVVDTMKRIYQSPTSAKFVEWMQQSPENYDYGLRRFYDAAWRVIAPARARQAAERAKTQQNKENQGKVGSIVSSGSGVRSNATNTSAASETQAQKIAREIASAF